MGGVDCGGGGGREVVSFMQGNMWRNMLASGFDGNSRWV